MQIAIRVAEINDTQEITRLSEQWGYFSSLEKMQDCLQGILDNQDHIVFVLLLENQIAGWIHGIYSLRVESGPFVEIGGLIVDKDFRRRGLGKYLIDKIIEWSTFRNCHLIRVRCNILRKEANAFYDRIGFREIKQQKVYDVRI
jgi:ribosomal protein S18 acetylase RimI-like enzyme